MVVFVASGATPGGAQQLRALRQARLAAGLTQMQVAAELNCQQGKINKIETGATNIHPRDLDIMLRLYDVPHEDRLAFKALISPGRPGAAPGSGPGRAYLEMVELESQASEILVLHSERIPKLLQCDRYLLAQFQRAGGTPIPKDLFRELASRSEMFSGENPVRYRAILSESSLHRMPGGRSRTLVTDQAKHLLDLGAAHENVSIHILPFEADIPFLDADVTVLKFADGRKSVSYVEHGTSSRIIRAPKAVAEHQAHWQMLHDAAHDGALSRKFLEDIIARAATGWSPRSRRYRTGE